MSGPALVMLLLVVVGSMSLSMTDVRAQGPEYDCVDVDLPPEGVCIPNVEGVTWGFGDTGCGYGLEVRLPAGTRVCFNVDFELVYVFDPDPADQVFVDIILDSTPPEYVLQPDTTPPSFTPTPTSTPSPVTPTPSSPTATPPTPASYTPTRNTTVVPPGRHRREPGPASRSCDSAVSKLWELLAFWPAWHSS
jgi:hypothetical protein